MPDYRVVEGTQVNYLGALYISGDVFEADEESAQAWLQGGYVEQVAEKKAAPKKVAPAAKQGRPSGDADFEMVKSVPK